MTNPVSRPTLVDVARAAGVSRATASRVMAGNESVRADLAQRVAAAAERLNYRTNTAARALRRGASGSIALIAPSSHLDGFLGPFVGAPLQGASAVLFDRALQPVLLLDDGRNSAPLIRHLSSGHVDAAVVILHSESEPLYRELDEASIPVIYVGHPTVELDPGRSFVDCDHYGGARMAVRALLEAGRRHIAMIGGPPSYFPAAERVRGFQNELDEWGVSPGPAAHGDFEMPSGSRAAAQLMRRMPDIDGLFVANDLMAVGALRVIEASGRRVPDDVSIVSYDDTVVAETADPPLTSVRQPFRDMGARAAEMALDSLVNPQDYPRHVLLPTTLTVRESV
ncbi:LacI family DNA-binding transcriptional regulator [Phytoactinopolyspora mesophila]|uniref:LacI family DNA-binding transcriptional regulator n=1 Tax=Phytoactinopolyspora mesophila TaxID=2650750 RepID=UPI001C9E5D80